MVAVNALVVLIAVGLATAMLVDERQEDQETPQRRAGVHDDL